MELTEWIAWLCAFLIGITLGLIGGGGSILTLPVFVYLLGINPELATTYSLFVVGISALVASIRNTSKRLINFKIAFSFAIPALTIVFIVRKILLPLIPESLVIIGGFELTKSIAIMLFFSIVMLLASYNMIKGPKVESLKAHDKLNWFGIVVQGTLVGLVTGFVGAGGGFLIIPALVFLVKIPMKEAVATSLLIITLNSLVGFCLDLNQVSLNWNLLMRFSLLAVTGIFVGLYLSTKINGNTLRKLFGWFLLVMGLFVVFLEFIGK